VAHVCWACCHIGFLLLRTAIMADQLLPHLAESCPSLTIQTCAPKRSLHGGHH
jgi:hypothetical protein